MFPKSDTRTGAGNTLRYSQAIGERSFRAGDCEELDVEIVCVEDDDGLDDELKLLSDELVKDERLLSVDKLDTELRLDRLDGDELEIDELDDLELDDSEDKELNELTLETSPSETCCEELDELIEELLELKLLERLLVDDELRVLRLKIVSDDDVLEIELTELELGLLSVLKLVSLLGELALDGVEDDEDDGLLPLLTEVTLDDVILLLEMLVDSELRLLNELVELMLEELRLELDRLDTDEGLTDDELDELAELTELVLLPGDLKPSKGSSTQTAGAMSGGSPPTISPPLVEYPFTSYTKTEEFPSGNNPWCCDAQFCKQMLKLTPTDAGASSSQ